MNSSYGQTVFTFYYLLYCTQSYTVRYSFFTELRKKLSIECLEPFFCKNIFIWFRYQYTKLIYLRPTTFSFQVSFSKDDRRLYSGGRKDDHILCWDLRNPGQVLHHLKREVSTNQRIQFGFAGDCVISGGTDGCVRIWDAQGSDM